MTNLQKLQTRAIEIRAELAELADPDAALTDETRAKLRELRTELRDVEEKRAALSLSEAVQAEDETPETGDAETRERRELVRRASLTAYVKGITSGRLLSGAEGELREALSCEANEIPFEMFEPETRAEERAVTEAPGTVGVNLQPIRPAVFAPSVLPRLGVDMPSAPSGTYAEGRISTSQTAEAKGKGEAIAATAGAITVSTTTPKRISARLELRLEDIAAVGQANFESMLRQNLALALSDKLDDQGLNGDGSGNNLSGLFQALTDPSAPAAGVADFDEMLSTITDSGIDGLWATELRHIAAVVGVDTFKLAVKSFRDAGQSDYGDVTFGEWAAKNFARFFTNKRMPAKASHIQQAILYRLGRSLEGGSQSMRTAVCPVWSRGVSIDDMYTGSAKAERYLTMHVLLGDVLIIQPDAYEQVSFRVSTA